MVYSKTKIGFCSTVGSQADITCDFTLSLSLSLSNLLVTPHMSSNVKGCIFERNKRYSLYRFYIIKFWFLLNKQTK